MDIALPLFSLFSLFMTVLTFILAKLGFVATFFKRAAFFYSALFFLLSIVSGGVFIFQNHAIYSVSNISQLLHTAMMKEIPEQTEEISAFNLYPREGLGTDSLEETSFTTELQEKILIDAPLISQLPELPRGCEVTSLAMMLQHANIDVDKMTLAQEIKKDTTPYQVKDGTIRFGNPYDGFVGNMYTFDEPGYGVYHGPVKELAEVYLPYRILDFTGGVFNEVLYHLNNGSPVWVILNTEYAELPKEYFQLWETPSAIIEITYKEHSVLVTGYDEDYIYFNDPLTHTKNQKAPRTDFKAAWVQMGSQAITYIPFKDND